MDRRELDGSGVGVTPVVRLPLDRRYSLRFCVTCNRRDALHFDGMCINADRHADRSCEGCGRQTSGRLCSECANGPDAA